jgi:hypothetical protein
MVGNRPNLSRQTNPTPPEADSTLTIRLRPFLVKNPPTQKNAAPARYAALEGLAHEHRIGAAWKIAESRIPQGVGSFGLLTVK